MLQAVKPQFLEETEYSKEESSIKEIILRQVKKIGDICAQELTKGYWSERPIKMQGGVMMSKEYHPDLREAYCNAVDFIVDISYPYSDQKFKDYVKDEKIAETIEARIKIKREMFKELNIMFERMNFFEASNISDE